MDAANRIIVNTIAQYTKTFISGILTLYSSRVVLQSLGVDDFGVYNLIAGVVTMLAFVTNALSSTTQRYLSLYHGKNDFNNARTFFTNSLLLHIFLGILISIILLSCSPLMLNGWLLIEESRVDAAKWVFISVIISLFMSFVTAPFRASCIAHENIVYISIIDTLDSVIKLLIAISLNFVRFDKLIFYGVALVIVYVFELFAFGLYALCKYDECMIPSFSSLSKKTVSDLSRFAGWNIFNIGCTVGRTQGLAIVVNKTIGVAANAAYGIAIQLNSYLNYISESLLNAVRPQIIKSEGESNREREFFLAGLSSRYSFFLLSAVSVPAIVNMPTLLSLWLGTVPKHSILFCRMVLVAGLVDSLTTGLSTVNQAIGKLRPFALFTYFPKLFVLPLCYYSLYANYDIMCIPYIYVGIEFITSLLRMPLLKTMCNFKIKEYLKNVYGKSIIPFLIYIFISYITNGINSTWSQILLIFFVSPMILVVTIYLFGTTSFEKKIIKQKAGKIIKWKK